MGIAEAMAAEYECKWQIMHDGRKAHRKLQGAGACRIPNQTADVDDRIILDGLIQDTHICPYMQKCE